LLSRRRALTFFCLLCAGVSTSLASARAINLVCKIACMADVSMTLPFRVQFSDALSGAWMDFCFVDQLEIASRICSCIAVPGAVDQTQFPLFGAGYLFSIRSTDRGVTLFIGGDADGDRRAVRLLGVGDFFGSRGLVFCDGIISA
jgi:hypothetical protein